MIAVITGDIVNSKKGESQKWLNTLKASLGKFGKQPMDWDIFRGDSFQLAISVEEAFITAIYIKAAIKSHKLYDVRLSIGLGEQEAPSNRVKEANGSAFYRSGEAFERLKKQRLIIKTYHNKFDEKFNLMFKLALLTADQWSPVVASTIQLSIENKALSQTEIAQLLNKSQSVISETLKRGGFDEIITLDHYYRQEVSTL